MRFIELFAGIGGFRYGLERTNVHKYAHISKESKQEERTQRGLGATDEQPVQLLHRNKSPFHCVWANEIDRYACQIYRKNYGGGELYEGDITKVKTDDIPDHDLLCAGFPCQSFSIAGRRRAFLDTRGTLFFEIARICREKKPRYILLENVKGLLSCESGGTFQTILKVLSDIGYILQWQVLNSKNFGVPQNRERVFIIGHLRGTSRPQVFPIGTYNSKNNSMANESNEIRNRTWSGSLRARGTTSYGSGDVFIKTKEVKIRRLTPTECERLQSFPDDWTEGISDTQRYKCLGNAVTVNVIQAIMEKLLNARGEK